MEQLIIAILVWVLIFIIIPFKRIKLLIGAALFAYIWMVFIDNFCAYQGYYKYQNALLYIGKASVFQNLFESGLGIIMINWLTEKSYSKLISVLLAGLGFALLHSFYIQRDLLTYGIFDSAMNFIFHIAALSIYTWSALAIVGEKIVYYGCKSRLKLFSH